MWIVTLFVGVLLGAVLGCYLERRSQDKPTFYCGPDRKKYDAASFAILTRPGKKKKTS